MVLPMGKRGQQPKEIDWAKVEQMALIQCTGEEIAAVLGVDYDTLQRACKREHGMKFADYIKQKGAGGKMSLRRKQYTTAMDGNSTMLIWLGKNWLGQKDKSDDEINAMKAQEPIVFVRATKPEDD